eukprot:14089976-Alexandrium_andersonii.AAC.1
MLREGAAPDALLPRQSEVRRDLPLAPRGLPAAARAESAAPPSRHSLTKERLAEPEALCIGRGGG